MQKIEIIVDTKGTDRVETKGFAGSDCVEASRFIEQALGKQVTNEPRPSSFRPKPSKTTNFTNAA